MERMEAHVTKPKTIRKHKVQHDAHCLRLLRKKARRMRIDLRNLEAKIQKTEIQFRAWHVDPCDKKSIKRLADKHWKRAKRKSDIESRTQDEVFRAIYGSTYFER